MAGLAPGSWPRLLSKKSESRRFGFSHVFHSHSITFDIICGNEYGFRTTENIGRTCVPRACGIREGSFSFSHLHRRSQRSRPVLTALHELRRQIRAWEPRPIDDGMYAINKLFGPPAMRGRAVVMWDCRTGSHTIPPNLGKDKVKRWIQLGGFGSGLNPKAP